MPKVDPSKMFTYGVLAHLVQLLHSSFCNFSCCDCDVLGYISTSLFSSPELKAQVSFSDQLSSVVCLSVCLSFCPFVCKLFTFSSSSGQISTKLGTKHPWGKGIQFSSNEGPRPFPRGDNYENKLTNFKNLLLQNHCANFNQTWHK